MNNDIVVVHRLVATWLTAMWQLGIPFSVDDVVVMLCGGHGVRLAVVVFTSSLLGCHITEGDDMAPGSRVSKQTKGQGAYLGWHRQRLAMGSVVGLW